MDDLGFRELLILTAAFLGLDYVLRVRPKERRARERAAEAASRRAVPVSRHPLIDLSRCFGCAACLAACPEQHGTDGPLELVDGQMALLRPSQCVGHSLCEAACPVSAITVTLGELAKDPTIPRAGPDGESERMPGVYVVGELSGTPLIKNAIEGGAAAMERIAARLAEGGAAPEAPPGEPVHDVVVVGLGPAGLAAMLRAEELGVRALAIEQDELGGTVASYPRQKLVLTTPVRLPIHGAFKRRETTKEELLDLWRAVADRAGFPARFKERATGLAREGALLRLRTSAGSHLARYVLLALGRRGTPRRLGVPGEELPKVTYQLRDARSYAQKRMLVVGGGDSAIEAACVLADDNEVTLSYRGDALFRLKPKNERRLKELTDGGKVSLVLRSQVAEIRPEAAVLTTPDGPRTVPNDYVIVLIGGEPRDRSSRRWA